MMKAHEFTIIAAEVDVEADDFEDRFFEAGCDDATISLQKGAVLVDFAREASSLDEAIESAIADVRRTGARVERIEPDPLVSLSDIARRSNLTRAAISNYASGERCVGFPAPVVRVTSESALWDWVSVAQWLFEQRKVPSEIVADARSVRQANDRIVAARIGLEAA